ncbi:hypothetical protein B0H13DRAFT_1936641 [Mycena leptocephala]|nr:hypothetical protein B0H13DRAFT_1936641 [Mycena leptocephala]
MLSETPVPMRVGVRISGTLAYGAKISGHSRVRIAQIVRRVYGGRKACTGTRARVCAFAVTATALARAVLQRRAPGAAMRLCFPGSLLYHGAHLRDSAWNTRGCDTTHTLNAIPKPLQSIMNAPSLSTDLNFATARAAHQTASNSRSPVATPKTRVRAPSPSPWACRGSQDAILPSDGIMVENSLCKLTRVDKAKKYPGRTATYRANKKPLVGEKEAYTTVYRIWTKLAQKIWAIVQLDTYNQCSGMQISAVAPK